ncbi:MAG: hypothetical protein Q9M19_05695 [Mariprofundaceae bacterium]|nr:hypothetical protein [Mariprofundaceae bacterium]
MTDLLSIDSFTAADFKFLLQSFVGSDTPYVLAGCQVSNPGDAIGTESVAINIHESVVYHPTSTAGPFFYGLEEGNANAAPLIPELRKNATNFVYLTFDTFDTAQDSRAFWDPDQNGGSGSEFSQDVNTESVLKLEVGVSVATFPEGTIPIAKIVLNASVITSIQDSRNMMFRLGTGGVSPDPFSNFDFRSLPNATYQRSEPSTTMSSSTSSNAFQGGDKNIFTFKEWMDVVMTKIKELGDTTYWYESASAGGGSSTASVSTNFLKSKGQWIHSDAIPGQVEFTEDIASVNLIDPRSIIFRASTKSLNDDQVLYADLIDGAEINTAGDSVDWVNNGYFISFASAGRFANLSKGDWIKKKTDTNDKWLRVEEFFTGVGGGGSVGTPTNALSILLSDAYQGSTTASGASAEYTKGVYGSSEVSIANRGSTALQSLTGTFFWLAARSDVIHTISNITSTTLVIDTITEADGIRARCYDASGHGLEDGYRITIGAGAYAGTHKVEVEDAGVFYITTTATGDEAAVSAFYGIATMTIRQSDDDNGGGKIYTGIDLESDTHNFDNDQSIIISNTTNYNGTFLITVPPTTVTDFAKKIQIALPSAPALENAGSATLPRMSVRDEFGITKIVQGQSTAIGDGTADTLKQYIGWTGSSIPDYFTSLNGSGYNAKDGMSNYNTDASDNLTTRAAKLTAMMADRIQDRGLMFDGITTITNTAGTSIAASATIDLIKPGSTSQTITLTTGSIIANSAVVVTMNRNGSGAIATSVEPLNNNFTLEENKLILFYRLGTTDIYTWDGMIIPAGETHTYGERLRPRLHTEQDRMFQLIKGGTWSWDATVGGGTLTWDANAFIQIPGIADASNQIDAGSQANFADGNILTLTIERTTGVNSLAVTNSAVTAATLTEDTVVLARRVGTSIIIGDLIGLRDGESSDLIEDATDQTQRDMQQNLNAKLIAGGIWSWDLGTSTLTWDADAFIQIPGVADASNQIDTGAGVLADGEVLSVELNRLGPGGSLAVSTTAIASLVHTPFTYIIARRVGNEIIVGKSFLLKDGEYLELDGALAEINRHHGQLKLNKGATPSKATIAAPDISLLDGETLGQEMNSFLLDIASDIVIDFNTGLITGGATGNAFTQGLLGSGAAIPSGEYMWYGIGLLPNSVGGTNKLSASVQVTPATTSHITPALAPYPVIVGTKKIGLVQILWSGTNATVGSIVRFGTGAGGGGSGTGDASSLTETLKNQLIQNYYEFVTPNIFSSNEEDRIDVAATGAYSAATTTFDIDTGETMVSTQSFDPDFLVDPSVVKDFQLTTFWDAGGIDTTADVASTFDINVVTYVSITASEYVVFFTPNGKQYVLWFNVSGSNAAPIVAGTDLYIEVNIFGLVSNDEVATAINTAISDSADGKEFTLTKASNVVTVLNRYKGTSATPAYVTGAEITITNIAAGRATYLISRDGGNEYQAVDMDRIGDTTDTFVGTHNFREENAKQTLSEEAMPADSVADLTGASNNLRLAQSFTVPASSAQVLKELTVDVTVTGSPIGNMYAQIIADDTTLPSTAVGDLLGESDAVDISALTTGEVTINMPDIALTAGTYHIALRTDSAYQAAYVNGITELAIDTLTTGTGASEFNGTVWTAIAGSESLVFAVKGSNMDLRVKIVSGAASRQLAGYGVFYDMSATTFSNQVKYRQVFGFNSVTDNSNEFVLTTFTPDPDLLEVYLVETGQVFKYPAFTFDGNKVIFPVNTFNNGGISTDYTLVIMQTSGASYDNSDNNALLLATNNLGSTDPSLDRSTSGRGIFLRKPNGELMEVALDDSNNLVIYST